MKKIIGTALPVFSLRSLAKSSETSGTFADGLIFLDWLKATGQSAWQMLPLSQSHLVPGSKKLHAPSPYQGYGIGLDPRFLSAAEREYTVPEPEKNIFFKKNKSWLYDYALFCALRDHFGTDDWTKWPAPIRQRRRQAIRKWRKKLSAEYECHLIEQCKLHQSFFDLRKKARKLGISIIGDISYYLPIRSPLVWVNQKSFDITSDGKMSKVSGVPNGPRSHFGRQVWGHPLYKWLHILQWPGIIRIWKIRFNYLNQLHDVLRLDHANGFYYYGAIDPADSAKDSFRQGPGDYALFRVCKYAKKIGLELFAEDGGTHLKDLRIGLRKMKMPGIKIMRFAYNEKWKSFENDYAQVKSYHANTYAYTTTHDTETLISYVRLLSMPEKKELGKKAGIKYSTSDKMFAERLRNAVLSSPAKVVIIPLQDWLLIKDRINIPGTEKMKGDRNWRFRLPIPIEKLPVSNVKKHIINSLKSFKARKPK